MPVVCALREYAFDVASVSPSRPSVGKMSNCIAKRPSIVVSFALTSNVVCFTGFRKIALPPLNCPAVFQPEQCYGNLYACGAFFA